MKKLIGILLFLIVFTVLSVLVLNKNGNSNVLYLLNWGEYINEDLVSKFEEEYNCQVVEETVTSSETMYQKISAGTTKYDVAIPGDYMIKKLKNENYLLELDVNNSKYQNLSNYNNIFVDSLKSLMTQNMEGYETYTMPYFWGTYSIIYNTKHSDTKEVVENNGFKALFDRSLYKEEVKIGMYSTARWTVSSYLMSEGLNPNDETFSNNDLVNGIKGASFDVWGDDALKRKTATGDLDLCFTQLGDFFDALYLALDEGLDKTTSGSRLDNLGFNVNVPLSTAAFFDGMVIPKTSKHYDLANEFINFMLDPMNAYENALAIGYCPTLKAVVDLYNDAALDENSYYYFNESDSSKNVTMKDFLAHYPMYLNPLYQVSDISSVYMLFEKDSSYMTRCETIVNQAKSKEDTSSNKGVIVCAIVVSIVVIIIGSNIGISIYKKKKSNDIQ